MPVPAYSGPNVSTANGVTTVFPYNFLIFDEAHIAVVVDDVEQTLNVDYTVSGVGVEGGGNVTFLVAPANGEQVVRDRVVPYERTEVDWQEGGSFQAQTLDLDVDLLEMQAQQLAVLSNRAMKAPRSVSSDQVISEVDWAARASKFLGFNSSDVFGLYAIAAADELIVSAYIESLLDAADAAAARLVLDAPSNAEAVLKSIIDAKGDLIVGTAADTLARLGVGAVNGMTLQVASGEATGLAWGYNSVVQRAYAEYLTNADLTTTIPADDTIPQQSTEGTLIASVTITPKSAANRIRIRCQGFMSGPNTAGGALALFQDSIANAIAGTLVTFSTAAPTVPICLEFEVSAASVSARTYKLHAGGTSTVRMNGSTSARYFGGIARTTMIVEEIAP